MTIRPARFSAGDLDRMYAASFARNAIEAVRRGDRSRALGLFEIWLDYPWDFHGGAGSEVGAALSDFHAAVEDWAPLSEVEEYGKRFLEAWRGLLEEFVLFLEEAELRNGDPNLAERLYELEQTYVEAGFSALEKEEIERLLENRPDPRDYLEVRKGLLTLA